MDTRIMGSGDLHSLVADVALVISGLHTQLTQSNPLLGKAFRQLMTRMVADPETPLWEIHNTGNGTCITIPKNIKEDM